MTSAKTSPMTAIRKFKNTIMLTNTNISQKIQIVIYKDNESSLNYSTSKSPVDVLKR